MVLSPKDRAGLNKKAALKEAQSRTTSFTSDTLLQIGLTLHQVADEIGAGDGAPNVMAFTARRKSTSLGQICASGLFKVKQRSPTLATALGPTDPDTLREELQQEIALEAIQAGGGRVKDTALQLWSLTGARQATACDQVLDRILGRLRPGVLDAGARERLLIDAAPIFSSFILEQELATDAKKERRKQRDRVKDTVAGAQMQALVAKVRDMLGRQEEPDPEDLLAAAGYYRDHMLADDTTAIDPITKDTVARATRKAPR